MACIVVAGRNPLYELTAADLVVRQLEELSLVNLKQLFQLEDRVDPRVCFLRFACGAGQWCTWVCPLYSVLTCPG